MLKQGIEHIGDAVIVSNHTENVKLSYKDTDSKYISAIENGDMQTAQKMVDEAAKLNGYDSPVLYHRTHSFGFTSFDLDKMDDRFPNMRSCVHR